MAALGNLTMIGDSLFRGSGTTFYSPAQALQSLLTSGGHTHTFVGTHNADPGSVPVSANGGWTVSDITGQIDEVGALDPDTVIVSIGTNDIGVSAPTIGTQITSYLNALETEIGSDKNFFIFAPINLSWFHLASYNLLRNAMEAWCSTRSTAHFGDLTLAGLNVDSSDGVGDGTHWSSAGATKVATYIDGVIDIAFAPAASDGINSTFKGIDLGALMAAAGAQAQGSQKAKYCADVAAALGTNPIYEIQVGGVVKYRTTVSGSLSSSSSGVALPTQFVEPPTVNVADNLTDAVEVIRNASNSAIEIRTPLKVGGGDDHISASKALDGSAAVRTSSRLLVPPATLDTNVGGGSSGSIYKMQTLIDDMSLANENGWYIEAAPNTADSNGPGGTRYAYIVIGLRRSDGRSYWPGEYLSDSAPQGVSLSDSSVVYCLPWYVAGRAAGQPERPNLRVQVRDMRLRGLKFDGTWETISTAENPMDDSSWHANFRRPGEERTEGISTGSGFAQIRTHSTAEGGGASLGSIGYGDDGSTYPRYRAWTNHGYAGGVTRTRKQWIDTYRGITISMEYRCILHDPNGPDHRSNSGLLMWMGADWYKNSPSGDYINGVASGRLKVITGDWKLGSVSEQSMTDLATYPISGFDPA